MTQDFGTPVPPPIEEIPPIQTIPQKKSNRTWIIIVIVVVVLCCCCVIVAGGYFYGDQIISIINGFIQGQSSLISAFI